MDNSEVLNSANSILQEVFVLDEKLLFSSSSVTKEKGWDKQSGCTSYSSGMLQWKEEKVAGLLEGLRQFPKVSDNPDFILWVTGSAERL